MALLFMESFDGYGGTASHATKWTQLQGLSTSAPTPRTGAYRIGGNNECRRVILPGSSTVILGMALYWVNSLGYFILWEDAAFTNKQQVSVTCDADGRVRVRTGSETGIAIGTTTGPVLLASTWNFIEAKLLVGNSGTYDIKVNGTSVLSGAGDTQNAATAAIGGLSMIPGASNGIDDLYLLDTTGTALNDFIGDCKVECLTAQTGNGSNVGLTCSTGTDHGALVDELPANDDTDYNSGTTIGVKDTYNFTNVATTGVIKAVQVSARAKKTDSATKELALVTRIGSTDYDGTTQAVASTLYSQYQQIWTKRPSDSADWTISDVNAAEFGLKVVT